MPKLLILLSQFLDWHSIDFDAMFNESCISLHTKLIVIILFLSESARQAFNLTTDFVKISEYEKLEKALMSGLPNEVDFVINVCTLLSNEGKHVLQLDKSRRLLDLLMAHVGVFDDGKLTRCQCNFLIAKMIL